MSLKKWISFFGRKRDAAIEWTGASPQRYTINNVHRSGSKRGRREDGCGVSWEGGEYFIEESACSVEMVEVG